MQPVTGPRALGAGDLRAAVQNKGHRGGYQVGSRQQCGVAAVEFILNSNSNQFQIKFELFQTLADPKRTFLSSKILKENIVVNVLKYTSSDSKIILN
jgi:hypothetical protein